MKNPIESTSDEESFPPRDEADVRGEEDLPEESRMQPKKQQPPYALSPVSMTHAARESSSSSTNTTSTWLERKVGIVNRSEQAAQQGESTMASTTNKKERHDKSHAKGTSTPFAGGVVAREKQRLANTSIQRRMKERARDALQHNHHPGAFPAGRSEPPPPPTTQSSLSATNNQVEGEPSLFQDPAVMVEAQVVDTQREEELERIRQKYGSKPIVEAVDVTREDEDENQSASRQAKFRFLVRFCGVAFICIGLLLVIIIGVVLAKDDGKSDEVLPLDFYGKQGLTVFSRALQSTDLWNSIPEYAVSATNTTAPEANGGPYTVLVPIDEAFQEIDSNYIENSDYVAHLRQLLFFHMIPGLWPIEGFVDGDSLETLHGLKVDVAVSSGSIDFAPSPAGYSPSHLNGDPPASIIREQLVDDRGNIVHVVNNVIRSPFMSNERIDYFLQELKVRTFYEWAEAVGIGTVLALGEFTAFAPSDEAFESTPASIRDGIRGDTALLQKAFMTHVVSGLHPKETLKTNKTLVSNSGLALDVRFYRNETMTLSLGNITARVTQTNGLTNNGIIHVSDTLLIPDTVYAALRENGTR